VEDHIKTNFRELGCEGVDRTHFSQDRDQWWILVNTVMNLRVQWQAGNFLTPMNDY